MVWYDIPNEYSSSVLSEQSTHWWRRRQHSAITMQCWTVHQRSKVRVRLCCSVVDASEHLSIEKPSVSPQVLWNVDTLDTATWAEWILLSPSSLSSSHSSFISSSCWFSKPSTVRRPISLHTYSAEDLSVYVNTHTDADAQARTWRLRCHRESNRERKTSLAAASSLLSFPLASVLTRTSFVRMLAPTPWLSPAVSPSSWPGARHPDPAESLSSSGRRTAAPRPLSGWHWPPACKGRKSYTH